MKKIITLSIVSTALLFIVGCGGGGGGGGGGSNAPETDSSNSDSSTQALVKTADNKEAVNTPKLPDTTTSPVQSLEIK